MPPWAGGAWVFSAVAEPTGELVLTLVTDADDPEKASQLLQARLTLA